MKQDLLEILREPVTGGALTLRNDELVDGEIESGELRAEGSGRSYPIVRGIPRFVPVDTYAESFGLQWNRYRTVQLDSHNGTHLSRDRFEAETRFDDAQLRDRWVLDMGCGAGRFAEVAASKGARIVGLDLSTAVDATYQTLRTHPKAHVVQASLFEPPFAPGTFDASYCIGVIQHTPDPARAVRKLVRMTKPGCPFAMTIYGRKPWTRLQAKYIARRLTRHVSDQALLGGVERLMPLLFPVTDRLFRVPAVGKLASFVLPVANYVHEPQLHERSLRYQFAVLDTFDMLAPAFDAPMTFEEVAAALREVGASRFEALSRVPVVVNGVR